ncbi:hypothetical protein PACTADRAFT_1445 [Pachysolen tannophilus NRRL Y-2460]|uniref:DUF2470 domain-containing protein n=1 Tax=Pachysolen tannophilus NRRL Y-2460 TaxID=669874 RepID=A0A1E4TYN8_PACTA|nr:hypothetical protein PACTADRAFT_1445 [Pachysolen tannophilus NRRL Y-2460]
MADAQSRILSHMNKSHRIAIEDYLCVYGDVKIDDKIANVRMKSIDLDNFTICFNHFDVELEIIKPIPFDPPLKDMSESRERLIEMAKFAAKKRGFSHFQINEIVYPNSILSFLIAFLTCYFILGVCDPSIFYYGYLQILKPYRFYLFLTLIIHAFEAKFLLWPKLSYYRVPLDYKIEWVIFALLEGFLAIKRFNKLASQLENPKKDH